MSSSEELMMHTLAAVAPGTHLRDGLERIVRGRTGALIVLGMDETVDSLCTGGFELDVDFSATRLRELAKMDGAIVMDSVLSKLLRAGVQLVPDPTIYTSESGTRHRTAERVAKQTGFPVVSVSQSMNTISIYVGGKRRTLEHSDSIMSRGNQALATLERYKARLDEVTGNLSALEVEDLVTVRDVAAVAQRLEMVRRITEEINGYVIELGQDGRLLSLQLDELTSGTAPNRELIIRDYLPTTTGRSSVGDVSDELMSLSGSQLLELGQVAKAMGLSHTSSDLDDAVSARGYRLLSRVPRLSTGVIEKLVTHFDDLRTLLGASTADLAKVADIPEPRAQAISEVLARLAEGYANDKFV